MSVVIFENARIFDGFSADCPEGMSVAVDGGRICEIADCRISFGDARRFDLGGRTLMPGLIDLHIHAYTSDINLQRVDPMGQAYRTAHAVRMLGHALDCGFTTVRDVGGGDWSLWRAVEDGLIRGPRFYYAGKILSMTGGHGDFRAMDMEGGDHPHGCACGQVNSLSVIADGVDQCIAAVREQFRRGAHMIKIMASGGVVSPTDPIWMDQYREDEIRAIVGECAARRSYAAAHCHLASAIRRCVECGVRCIEHGTLIDDETAAFVAKHGVYVVPTMAVGVAMSECGRAAGLPSEILGKMDEILDHSLASLDRMRRAEVKLGFGTDLVGHTYVEQCREFLLRSEVFTPLEILRQATSVGAEVLQQQGQLGCIAAGAHADLLVVDGDPVRDIGLLAQNGNKLALIMRAGGIVKNRLASPS